MSSIKALTLLQPWASLIAGGYKTIETRSWSTRYRGPLAIHAGKTVNAFEANRHGYHPTTLPSGAFVASAVLLDVVPITRRNTGEPDPGDGAYIIPYGDGVLGLMRPGAQLADFSITDQRTYGDFSPGRYGWLLGHIRPIDPPVPTRGRQGLWNVEVVL